ncbi:MAG: hypothetical protein LLG97_04595, partial [Deltaproteobacteria bacterium]|nr:hypothetical protein [Deltaproteobacteria bacterium]
ARSHHTGNLPHCQNFGKIGSDSFWLQRRLAKRDLKIFPGTSAGEAQLILPLQLSETLQGRKIAERKSRLVVATETESPPRDSPIEKFPAILYLSIQTRGRNGPGRSLSGREIMAAWDG